MIIKMMKTCSRMKSIGDNYKETIFAQPTTGIQLMIFVTEVWFKNMVRGIVWDLPL